MYFYVIFAVLYFKLFWNMVYNYGLVCNLIVLLLKSI